MLIVVIVTVLSQEVILTHPDLLWSVLIAIMKYSETAQLHRGLFSLQFLRRLSSGPIRSAFPEGLMAGDINVVMCEEGRDL